MDLVNTAPADDSGSQKFPLQRFFLVFAETVENHGMKRLRRPGGRLAKLTG